MSVQLLISTLECENYISFLEHMRVNSDAVLINQCSEDSTKEIIHRSNVVNVYECNERGIGKSRNMAIMKASADYCLFTDDDMVFCNDYENIIEKAFRENPNTDVIIFNIAETTAKDRNQKKHRVGWHNYMRFGAAGLAVRKSSIIKNGIFFNLCFGGGAMYGSGEDTLFLTECLRKKLRMDLVPIDIAHFDSTRESTWFNGYNEKYFYDKGCLYCAITKKYAKLLCIVLCLKNFKEAKEVGVINSIKLGFKGIKDFKTR